MTKTLIRAGKIIVSVALVLVIWRYFGKIENWGQIYHEIRNTSPLLYFTAVAVSMFNWGMEARKWQVLLRNLQPVSFLTAWRSTCAGAAISNILPFRIGEYLGRVLYVNEENRIPAIFNSVFGSTVQLAVSLAFGIPASLFVLDEHMHKLTVMAALSLVGIILFFSLVFVFGSRIKPVRKKWMQRLLDDIRKFSKIQIAHVILLSVLRYILFSSFYALLLHSFGLDLPIMHIYAGVSTIYLLQSFAPSMILTDVGLRTGLPLMVFKTPAELQPAILAAAIINYFFNILFPAIFGLYFIVMKRIESTE